MRRYRSTRFLERPKFFRQGALFLLVAPILFVLSGCSPFEGVAPQGFAPYAGADPFHAVSPDGVMYRIRDMKNKPVADLPFWKEALKKRMIDAGYRFVAESDVNASGHPGYLLELSAPLGTQDFIYLNGIFVKEGRLIIVEAAGEVTLFQARHDAILEAIQKIRF